MVSPHAVVLIQFLQVLCRTEKSLEGCLLACFYNQPTNKTPKTHHTTVSGDIDDLGQFIMVTYELIYFLSSFSFYVGEMYIHSKKNTEINTGLQSGMTWDGNYFTGISSPLANFLRRIYAELTGGLVGDGAGGESQQLPYSLSIFLCLIESDEKQEKLQLNVNKFQQYKQIKSIFLI